MEAGWSVEELGGAKGRGVVARRAFSAGAVVLEDRAYAHAVVGSELGSLCDCCLAHCGQALRWEGYGARGGCFAVVHERSCTVRSAAGPCNLSPPPPPPPLLPLLRPGTRHAACCATLPSPSAGALHASWPAMPPRSTRRGHGAQGTEKSAPRCGPVRRTCRPPPCAWRCAARCGAGGPSSSSKASSRRCSSAGSWRAGKRCCSCGTTGMPSQKAPSCSLLRWARWRTACWRQRRRRRRRPPGRGTWRCCWHALAPTATPSGAAGSLRLRLAVLFSALLLTCPGLWHSAAIPRSPDAVTPCMPCLSPPPAAMTSCARWLWASSRWERW